MKECDHSENDQLSGNSGTMASTQKTRRKAIVGTIHYRAPSYCDPCLRIISEKFQLYTFHSLPLWKGHTE